MKNLSTIIDTYRYLFKIMIRHAPLIVIAVLLLAVLSGLVAPFSVYVNSNIFNIGLEVAAQEKEFASLIPFLILFVFSTLAPNLITLFIDGCLEPRSVLIFRTAFKGEMLQKLKRLEYKHLESEKSMEIIDKAYSRAENSARHLFPMYVSYTISSLVGALGSLYILASIRWWLLFSLLLPFILEAILAGRSTFNIYTELESYWQREKEYEILKSLVQSRGPVRENRLNQSSAYLIDTYRQRFNARNRQYERFFFRNLKKLFLSSNLSRFATWGNVLILLILYAGGALDTGLFIAATLLVFNSLYEDLSGSIFILKWGHYHANFFNYYRQYFALSEDKEEKTDMKPVDFSIEFRDVWFKYPGTEEDVLRGVSFFIGSGEKVSIVGKNGAGKTTMVKLLLGLFAPDRGEILIGGKPLRHFTLTERVEMFGTIFQDFSRFNITLEENVVIGALNNRGDKERFAGAIEKAGLVNLLARLPQKEKTLLGKEFEDADDLSGGQWQRLAMARALFAAKPVLILDEPTSQLDPMAESDLYKEFAHISTGKTAIFITHRLGSTAITDNIIVLSHGLVAQKGSHAELLAAGGLYADMFESQKSWYDRNAREVRQDG